MEGYLDYYACVRWPIAKVVALHMVEVVSMHFGGEVKQLRATCAYGCAKKFLGNFSWKVV